MAGPHQRVEFHEITTDAVQAAFEHPREIDMQLVDAQQARRVLDRLVGYKISPLLWSKVRRGLCAGRVQSVALRMVVDREREIDAFVPQEYWTIEAELAKQADADDQAFTARLAGLPGTKKAEIDNGEQAEQIVADLRARGVSRRRRQEAAAMRRPAPPFTTSTLQQEARAARLHRQAHDGAGAAALRRSADPRRGPGRSHHLHANRLD